MKLDNIPKILHLYWDGRTHLSFLQYLTMVTFKELNPDWAIKLYVPMIYFKHKTWKSFEQKIEYTGKNYYRKLSDYAEIIKIDFETIGFRNDISEIIKSDYLRYYLLSTQGGGWADFDIIFLKPISEIANGTNTQIIGDENKIDTVITYFDGHFPVGFFMASKNNKVFKIILQNCSRHYDSDRYQSLGVELWNRVFVDPERMAARTKCNILFVNNETYLPYKWFETPILFEFNQPDVNTERVTENSIGIHWFNGSNEAKNFENDFSNGEHYKDAVICKYMEKYKDLV